MTQASTIGLGADASVLAAYAYRSSDRLGNFDILYENIGDNDAYLRVKQLVGTTYTDVDVVGTIKAKGTVSRSYCLVAQQIAFFGSGNTSLNASFAIRTPSDLRGASFTLVPVGRQGWSTAPGYNSAAYNANLNV